MNNTMHYTKFIFFILWIVYPIILFLFLNLYLPKVYHIPFLIIGYLIIALISLFPFFKRKKILPAMINVFILLTWTIVIWILLFNNCTSIKKVQSKNTVYYFEEHTFMQDSLIVKKVTYQPFCFESHKVNITNHKNLGILVDNDQIIVDVAYDDKMVTYIVNKDNLNFEEKKN